MDYSNIPTGLKITSQIPLDVKEYCLNEATLAYLGPSNNLAFTYHDGLKVYCLEEKTIWEWREITIEPADSGLIVTGDFTYPNNSPISFGFNYANKTYNFFKIEYQNLSDVKVYDATSLGTGETIYKDKTVAGNNVTFNFKEVTTADAGTTGIPVLTGASTSGDNIVITGKRIKTTNLDITESGGEITIDAPSDPTDVKFYVNENYTGGGSNGSLSKPYTNLKAAFDAYIDTANGGTILAPRYGGIATIEFLSNVTVPSTGPTAMTYISVNLLRLKGNGYILTYQGTQDYFISTAYLVGLDPKTTSQKLDNNIYMEFEDLIIESQTKHKIVSNLNYTSPIFSGVQNASGMKFENCTITDSAYLEELADYTDSTVDLFGLSVFVQNTLPKNQYMIRNQDINWYGEGALIMENCKLNGSSSTIIYNLNSSLSFHDIDMSFNSYYINYKDTTGSVYNPMESIYYILNETNGLSGRTEGYFRIENFTQSTQTGSSGGSPIGGADALCRTVGNGIFIIFNGSFYSDKLNNLIQLHNTDSRTTLTNLNAIALTIADATYGAFKYTGTIPGAPVFVDVNLSIINNVKNWTTLQFIRPTANSATLNGAYFTDKPTYPDDNAAKAAGLIPGNVYYDTTGQIATRVA